MGDVLKLRKAGKAIGGWMLRASGVRAFPARFARGFSAGKDSRLLAGWIGSSENINAILRSELAKIRARARDLHLNNDFVRRFVSMCKTNVVGPRGVRLQAQTPGRKGDGDMDTKAALAIEAAWKDWGRRQNCDLQGRMSWVEAQGQAIVSAAVDGEILVRHWVGKQGGKYAYKIEHLDPEALDVTLNQELANDCRIMMGIEYDGYGRVLAYHFRNLTKNSTLGYQRAGGAAHTRVPANQITHAFIPDHVGQLRGYPWMTPAMSRLKMLEGYFEAAIAAARAGAAKMGFLEAPAEGDYDGDDTDADGEVISDFETGIVEKLPYGWKFNGFDPRYPHEQFGEFVKTCIRTAGVSMAGGISYAGLSGDLEGVNFSSIRTGVLEDREAWKAMQEWFIDAYIVPIFENWLTWALTAGQIKVQGEPLSSAEEDRYRVVNWQPRRWAWVDPKSDMETNILAINNNITSTSAVIRELGEDPQEVFAECVRDKEQLAKAGLSPKDALKGVASGSAA